MESWVRRGHCKVSVLTPPPTHLSADTGFCSGSEQFPLTAERRKKETSRHLHPSHVELPEEAWETRGGCKLPKTPARGFSVPSIQPVIFHPEEASQSRRDPCWLRTQPQVRAEGQKSLLQSGAHLCQGTPSRKPAPLG